MLRSCCGSVGCGLDGSLSQYGHSSQSSCCGTEFVVGDCLGYCNTKQMPVRLDERGDFEGSKQTDKSAISSKMLKETLVEVPREWLFFTYGPLVNRLV